MKKPLIGVSICAVVLLVLGSFSNVVGYQTVQSSSQNVIPQAESEEPIKRDTSSLVAATYDDALTDKIRDPHQSNDGFFLKHAFVWGTYEHCWKDWSLSFEIENENPTDLTIHVIGYGHYGPNDENIWVHIEACQVYAQRHLGILGPHQCCIFAFGPLGVAVYGVRQ